MPAPELSRPAPDSRGTLETERERVVDFPVDIFECSDAMPSLGDVRILAFRALLPAVRRVVVHAVLRRPAASSCVQGERRECYGVYLLDCDGGEHPFLDFGSAGRATYAAMRVAQVFRLPVEFGTFAEPRSRDD